jgi:hypothetical protein
MIWWIIYILITAILVWIAQTTLPSTTNNKTMDFISNTLFVATWPFWAFILIIVFVFAALGATIDD